MSGRGRAGAKVILLGEHAVVYGRPAVAAGLPLEVAVWAERGDGPRVAGHDDPRGPALVEAAARALGMEPSAWVITIASDVPVGRGLGSSAALAVATLRALADAAGRPLADDAALRLGRLVERVFHGTPSGIDPAAAALGRCIRFVAGEPPVVEPVPVAIPVPLVIAFDDTPRDTAKAVGALRTRHDADPPRYEALFDAVAEVVAAGVTALREGDLARLGRCLDENQALLVALGVSSPVLDERVRVARAAGALGAKLTGGGAGGAIIALAPDAAPVADALAATGAHVLHVRVG